MATTELPPVNDGIDYTGTGSIDDRIARIIGAVQVTANKTMNAEGRSYAYATIDQMAASIGPLLAAEGVTITPTRAKILETQILERPKTDRDGVPVVVNGTPILKRRHLTTMRVTWRVAASGESFEAESIGKSADPEGSEKDVNQAHSFARINLYKSMFHLVTGDDPEAKPAASNGNGASSYSGPAATGTGELPTFIGSVWARISEGANGGITVKSGTDEDADFQSMRAMWRGLGGQFDRDSKLWIYPADKAATVIDVARGYGFAVAPALEAQYPAPPPPASAPAAPAQDSLPVADERPPTTYDPGDIPDDGDDVPF